MNNDQGMYKKEGMSRVMVALWALAVIAIVVVVSLFLWGKTIHDGLPA